MDNLDQDSNQELRPAAEPEKSVVDHPAFMKVVVAVVVVVILGLVLFAVNRGGDVSQEETTTKKPVPEKSEVMEKEEKEDAQVVEEEVSSGSQEPQTAFESECDRILSLYNTLEEEEHKEAFLSVGTDVENLFARTCLEQSGSELEDVELPGLPDAPQVPPEPTSFESVCDGVLKIFELAETDEQKQAFLDSRSGAERLMVLSCLEENGIEFTPAPEPESVAAEPQKTALESECERILEVFTYIENDEQKEAFLSTRTEAEKLVVEQCLEEVGEQ